MKNRGIGPVDDRQVDMDARGRALLPEKSSSNFAEYQQLECPTGETGSVTIEIETRPIRSRPEESR